MRFFVQRLCRNKALNADDSLGPEKATCRGFTLFASCVLGLLETTPKVAATHPGSKFRSCRVPCALRSLPFGPTLSMASADSPALAGGVFSLKVKAFSYDSCTNGAVFAWQVTSSFHPKLEDGIPKHTPATPHSTPCTRNPRSALP